MTKRRTNLRDLILTHLNVDCRAGRLWIAGSPRTMANILAGGSFSLQAVKTELAAMEAEGLVRGDSRGNYRTMSSLRAEAQLCR